MRAHSSSASPSTTTAAPVGIVAALDGGATTAFEVARTLFRRLPDMRIGQAMTEVIGHLDVLAAAERALVVDREPWRYELTEVGKA